MNRVSTSLNLDTFVILLSLQGFIATGKRAGGGGGEEGETPGNLCLVVLLLLQILTLCQTTIEHLLVPIFSSVKRVS